ncbi:MAG: hypothetical protein ABSF45_00540 [Terriglobia bacterium]|jgi:hypothetical protein
MKSTSSSVLRLTVILVILAVPPTSTVLMNGQEGQERPADGVPRDWTHHRLVFSHPGSADEAMRRGTYERWLQIAHDPRYIMQQQERSANAPGAAGFGGVFAPEPGAGRPDARSDADIQMQEEAGAIEMSLEERDAQFARRGLPSGLVRAIRPYRGEPDHRASSSRPKTRNRMHKDWSETLGSNGTTGLGEFPAVYTTGGASCTDFAIYNTGLAGSSSQADLIAYNNLYSSCDGGTPTAYWAYNTGTLGGASATISNSVVLSLDGTQVAFVQSVPYPVTASGTLTANTGVVPTAGTTIRVGATTYTWETTASITTVNQMSTSGITLETEISQTLYAALTGSRANCPTSNTTCIAATQPANSSITPTLSGETVTVAASCGPGTCGNSVVFTQSGATGMTISGSGTLSGGSGTAGVGGAQLVVLKWAAGGTLTSPATLTSNSSYPNCTAPCMISVPFHGTPTDTYSAPFVAYAFGSNPSTVYVGDDAGVLHQFTNIFASGTPAEVTTGGWPVTVNANTSLASPNYDAVSTKVFIGDYALGSSSLCELFPDTNPCGFLYSISPSGTVVKSAQLDYNSGIMDGPLVDSNTGEVYAFVGDDGSANCAGGPCSAVYQFPVDFTGGATGTEATVGPGYEFMLAGSFDNAYFTSLSNSGNLYVIGNTGPANNTLYRIPITNGVMSTSSNAGPAVSSNYTNGYYSGALQVTEICQPGANPCTAANGWTDYLMLSVLAFGSPTTNYCGTASLANGCVIGFNVTSGTINSSTTPTAAAPEAGGTSGIVVDNTSAGAQNIYFSTLLNQSCTTSGGTGGCAIQTLQSAP